MASLRLINRYVCIDIYQILSIYKAYLFQVNNTWIHIAVVVAGFLQRIHSLLHQSVHMATNLL